MSHLKPWIDVDKDVKNQMFPRLQNCMLFILKYEADYKIQWLSDWINGIPLTNLMFSIVLTIQVNKNWEYSPVEKINLASYTVPKIFLQLINKTT